MAAGLSNLNVTAMLEDHTGAVWIGTENGVYLADGERFLKQEVFTAAGVNMVVAMREDSRGRIWVMDQRHLLFWDGSAVHQIEGLKLRRSLVERRDLIALPGEPDAVFLLSGGDLLRVSSGDGGRSWTTRLAVLPEQLERHPELRKLTSVRASGDSTIWAGCGTMLCHLDLSSGRVENFGERQGVAPDAWSALLVTRKGDVWARGAKSLLQLRAGSARFEAAAPLPSMASLAVLAPLLVEDPSGRILLNVQEGVARSSHDGWRIFDHRSGLPDGEMQVLLFDRTGALWIGPQGLGVGRFAGYGAWSAWTKTEGLRSNVVWASVKSADGTVWSLSDRGLDRLDRLDSPSRQFVPAKSTLPLDHLRVAVADARDHLWLGDAKGKVIEYEPATGKTRIAADGLGHVIKLLIDRQKRVWVCSQQGLRFFSPQDGWRSPHAPEHGFPAEGYAWSITEGPTGLLWVTNGQGLFRFDGQAWVSIALPFPGGKQYNFMVAAAPDGTLWAQGIQPFPVTRLRVDGTHATVIERVPSASFGSDNITFMATDRRGWLWVGSDDGIHVYNGERWVQATSEDGLIWDDTDFNAFSEDLDGSVRIGTSGGLSHLVHPERLFSATPPTVRIREARVGEAQLHGIGPSFDLRRPVLRVSMLNTNYSREGAVIYRYRLEGQENEWQEDRTGELRFPALDAGQYKLTVVAYDTRLQKGSEPVSLAFTVLEPWWRRPWFFCMEGVLGLLAGFAIWRYTVHLLVERQQELERLVTSRTGELEREKAELLCARSALLEMTRRDSLTGLLNRAAIFEQMGALCEAALASGRPLALAMADLDSFKRINDQYGHVMGDTVLRECSRRIEGALRLGDAVGRYGGEELLILLPGLYPEHAAARMEQLRVAIAGAPVVQGTTSLTVTCSFGVAWMSGERCSLESLVEMADAALYRAKQNGRNRVEFASHRNGDLVPQDRIVDAVSC